MNRDRIDLNDSMVDVIIKMAEGNPGAVTVLSQLIKQDDGMGFLLVLSLDDMNIRGTQVWVGYKDYCNSDLSTFMNAIRNRDPEMVATINREVGDTCPPAVTHGGSY